MGGGSKLVFSILYIKLKHEPCQMLFKHVSGQVIKNNAPNHCLSAVLHEQQDVVNKVTKHAVTVLAVS